MHVSIDDFRVRHDEPVDLDKWPTKVKPVYRSKADYHKILRDHVERLSDLQDRLAASEAYAVAADPSGHGRRRQGWNRVTCPVRREPAALPGL